MLMLNAASEPCGALVLSHGAAGAGQCHTTSHQHRGARRRWAPGRRERPAGEAAGVQRCADRATGDKRHKMKWRLVPMDVSQEVLESFGCRQSCGLCRSLQVQDVELEECRSGKRRVQDWTLDQSPPEWNLCRTGGRCSVSSSRIPRHDAGCVWLSWPGDDGPPAAAPHRSGAADAGLTGRTHGQAASAPPEGGLGAQPPKSDGKRRARTRAVVHSTQHAATLGHGRCFSHVD